MKKQQVMELIAAIDHAIASLKGLIDHLERMKYALAEQQKRGAL